MDKDLLKRAQGALRITDVALRETTCMLKDRFEPKYEHPEMDVQFLQRTARSEVLEIEDGGNAKHKLFRVYVDLGIRWVKRPPKPRVHKRLAKKAVSKVPVEPDVFARIEATFMAEYEMSGPVDKPELSEFAQYNAPFNVWPFWREYVASQANRMNLPKATLPLRGFRRNQSVGAKQMEPE